MDSRISGFYKLQAGERLGRVVVECGISDEGARALSEVGLTVEQADGMIENAIGTFEVPLGVAVNFQVNGKDYLIPMATEEPSVVAAASNAAKMARAGGGFKASSTDPIMVGQIQVINPAEDAGMKVLKEKEKLIEEANRVDPTLVKFGGGVKDITVRDVEGMLVVHLHVNVADAMGANAVNTMCEALAPRIEELSGGEVVLKILSNYAFERTARAECRIPADAVGGEEVVDRIISAYDLAASDIYRAVTHNKGVMNGVTAVVLATGNDTRAVEAGCHSYACKDGRYTSLTRWRRDKDGSLLGEMEIPVAVGVVGGATRTHPVARSAVKILGVKTARELGEVLAAVGLAQNLAALRALAAEGIQKGHMRLHARNIAVTAGATEDQVEEVAGRMVDSGRVSVDEAKKIIEKL
ncbi:MAG: hydroxymethylglutaryl-CoA reductase, degradative [Candidatus Altiarchaeales archaeon]|nr:hydroxymethylglutaryl-CoA reductase, degradative [Candidatus Altiarchaeales archaeon]MBD3416940.1 hydroxymethylglutaryl-CoA reductase, degradative [Candidatus Altiarchaeales archaeon]